MGLLTRRDNYRKLLTRLAQRLLRGTDDNVLAPYGRRSTADASGTVRAGNRGGTGSYRGRAAGADGGAASGGLRVGLAAGGFHADAAHAAITISNAVKSLRDIFVNLVIGRISSTTDSTACRRCS